jgi:HEAT repeat protein
VNELIKAVGGLNEHERLEAAKRLGGIKDPRAAEALIAILNDSDADLRHAATDGLKRIGTPAVEPLITALKDPDSYVRKRVAYVLGEIRDPRAVEALSIALKDPDRYVRRAAVDALGEINDPRVAEALSAALNDSDADLRHAAADWLKKIGAPAVEALIVALKNPDEFVRETAADALREVKDPRAVEPLTVALNDQVENVRTTAVHALGEIGDSRAVDALSTALNDSDADLRHAAADGLKSTGAPAVKALIVALKNPDGYVRETAADALREIKDPRAVEALSAALKDSDRYVQTVAADALEGINDPRAVEALSAVTLPIGVELPPLSSIPSTTPIDVRNLIKKLFSNDALERAQAADRLGKMGRRASAAAPFLMSILADNRTLSWITYRNGLRRNEAPTSPCEEAIQALGKIGNSTAILAIEQQLHEDHKCNIYSSLSVNALVALHAVDALIDIVRTRKRLSEPLESLREVLDALIELRARNAVPILVDALTADDIALSTPDNKANPFPTFPGIWICHALGELGDPEAIESLTDYMNRTSSQTQKDAAAAAIQKLKSANSARPAGIHN